MKRKFKFDDYEVDIIIKALIEMRNQLIAEGRYTDAVDELLIMLCKWEENKGYPYSELNYWNCLL